MGRPTRRDAAPAHVRAAAMVAVTALAAALAVGTTTSRPEPAAAAPTSAASTTATSTTGSPRSALSHDGRWLTDDVGRVVQLHGVNMVQKTPWGDPLMPAEAGFDRDDAVFLREQGLNVVRLGVEFGSLMPQPGVIDHDVIASIAGTVRVLGEEGLYVQVDLHQDGYGHLVHGNGFPEWATLTDGLPNPEVGFPAYYTQNPALQRAFDNFWENVPGPDGVPLQEHYATALREMAAAVADEPNVIGYDTMNEPWPGTVWEPCITGCPDLEQARLAPFAERMTAAIRSVDPDAIVWTEPFVLFNFGFADTSLSGFGAPQSGLSFHVYALTPEGDEATIDRAVAASARGDAILATEFGATNDPTTIGRLTGALDTRLVPWIFWAYNENVIVDLAAPPTPGNVRQPVVAALARPYATATNGTPTAHAFDPTTGTFDYEFSALRPGGARADTALATVLATPATAYPDGYTVEVTGGWVASQPGAAELVVCTAPGADAVGVSVTAGADPTPAAPRPCEATPVSVPTTATTTVAARPATTTAAPRFTG